MNLFENYTTDTGLRFQKDENGFGVILKDDKPVSFFEIQDSGERKVIKEIYLVENLSNDEKKSVFRAFSRHHYGVSRKSWEDLFYTPEQQAQISNHGGYLRGKTPVGPGTLIPEGVIEGEGGVRLKEAKKGIVLEDKEGKIKGFLIKETYFDLATLGDKTSLKKAHFFTPLTQEEKTNLLKTLARHNFPVSQETVQALTDEKVSLHGHIFHDLGIEAISPTKQSQYLIIKENKDIRPLQEHFGVLYNGPVRLFNSGR